MPSHQPFAPWGFNCEHDDAGRLLEDYREREWARVEEDFRKMEAFRADARGFANPEGAGPAFGSGAQPGWLTGGLFPIKVALRACRAGRKFS